MSQAPIVNDRHEAWEPERLANTLLDRIEADVVAVIEAGGELALRTRFARLLPTPAKPKPPRRHRSATQGIAP
jgi:hypothetical protein